MNIPAPVVAVLQRAMNAALELDPAAKSLLSELDQAVVQIHLTGLDADIFLLFADVEVEITGYFDGEVDTTIAGSPLALAGLSRDMQGIFDGSVEIQGDMAVGRKVKRFLAELDMDWEEQLSRLFGDTAAHQLGRVHREITSLLAQTISNFQNSTAEYLTEESRVLVNQSEYRQFLAEVDELKADTDRLEARVNLLLHSLQPDHQQHD